MLFNSYEFLFAFLPAVLLIYWGLLREVTHKTLFLIGASYFFYGFWNPWFTLLMMATTTTDFFFGKAIAAEQDAGRRRRLLTTVVVFNLCLLGFFKYYNFFAGTTNSLAHWVGLGNAFPILDIILPVGISFYTFQSMSYTIDIYRRKAEPARSYLKFAAYVSMFPQLVAGPIVRHSDLLHQFEPRNNPNFLRLNHELVARGLVLFSLGMAKKILIADRIAEWINPMFADYQNLEFVGAWAAMVGYAFQIYFDFSGYSDMAIGLALLLGFQLPQNFNSPYKSENITEFWRRWHMSLSQWLRDYLYISLGGNRHGAARTYRNLFLTMLLGGLWHGASWNYVLWGSIHGALLAAHKFIAPNAAPQNPARPNYLKRFAFFLVIVFTWVFFRCETLAMSGYMLQAMGGMKGFAFHNVLSVVDMRLLGWLGVAFLVANFLPNSNQIKPAFTFPRLTFYALLLGLCLMFMTEKMEFLYFQF